MLGNTIKDLRKLKHLSQKELAEKCKLSASYIQQIELGQKNNPSLEVLIKIAKALDVSVTNLRYPTDEDKAKAVNEFENIMKSAFYDKPAIETLEFLVGQIKDTRLKNLFSDKIKNNMLDDKAIQYLVSKLSKDLELELLELEPNSDKYLKSRINYIEEIDKKVSLGQPSTNIQDENNTTVYLNKKYRKNYDNLEELSKQYFTSLIEHETSKIESEEEFFSLILSWSPWDDLDDLPQDQIDDMVKSLALIYKFKLFEFKQNKDIIDNHEK
jgi:transcriptional regulator with XRE-family HTH domain